MKSTISPIKGHVKVEVIEPSGNCKTVVNKKNTLVKEAPKAILGQLVAPTLLSSNTTFPKTDASRPDILAYAAGPQNNNSIGYMKFGYYTEGESATSITVAATDSTMGSASNHVLTEVIDSSTIQEYSIQFVCEFAVTEATATNNYVEAGLFTVGANYDTGTSALLAPSAGTFNSASLRMLAHQSHTAVQASSGSTIRYTWTLTMQEPS
jgi:hypothetical protein